MFKKDMKYSLLLDFYGDLLSERKKELIELYYNEDLSLSEVSEISGISRQGVRDSVKKAENELEEYEAKLGMAKRFEDIRNNLEAAIVDLHNLAEKNSETANDIYAVADFLSKINL
jgi:predicted DNA-binding protein YlxM (UPF0122 family)